MFKLGLFLFLLVDPAPQYEVIGQLSAATRTRFAVVRLESIDGRVVLATSLGADGKFRFNRLVEGQYFVSVRLNGNREVRQTLSVLPAFADRNNRVVFRIDVDRAVIQPQAHQANVASLLVSRKARSELRKAFEARGDLEKAQQHLERALEISPNFEEALNNLGTIYHRKRDFSQAKELFERALKANPESFAARVNLAGSLLGLADFNRAVVEGAKAVALRPGDSLAQAQLGLSYFYLRRYADAIPHLQLAKQSDPMSPTLPGLFLGMIQEQVGDAVAALGEYEEFLKTHPGHPQTRMVQQRLSRLRPD